jgi:hypothetical protein
MTEELKLDPNTPVKLVVTKGRTVPGTTQYSSERADYTLEMTTTMGAADVARSILDAEIEKWLPKMPLPPSPPVQPTPANTPAPSPTPVGSPRTKEGVAEALGEIANRLNFEYTPDGAYIKIKPAQFLGSENFGIVASKIRGMGGEYISAGKDSHFRVARKK